MGLTVLEVIERAQEEAFEAGGIARPAWDTQSGSITSSGTTLTLQGTRPYGNVPPDGIVEWIDDSMEMAEVKDATGDVATLQTRGYLSTTAASHSADVKVIFDPPYPRQALVNGLKAVIGQLTGFGLYAVGYTDSLTLATSAPVQLPTGAIDILDPVLYRNGTQWFPLVEGTGYRVFHNYTGLNTAPALDFYGGNQGAAMKIFYKKDYDLDPFALSTDLETAVGLSPSLTPHLPTALAGHVLMGRDVPMLESEHIRPDPQNPQPPGSRFQVGRAIWNAFVSGPVYTERAKNQRSNPPTMVFGG